MVEAGTHDEALTLLQDQYGEDRVVSEPTLKGDQTVYPDIAVFRDVEQTAPFLLVECSSLRTTHRTHRDLEEISEAVTSTEVPYGALLAPDVEFVFSGSGPAYRTHASLPELDGDEPPEKRAIQSRAELDFLVDRSLAAQNAVRPEPERENQVVDEFLESLHLLLEARRDDKSDCRDVDQETVSALYESIDERHDWYQQGEALDPQFLTVIAHLFNGFDLTATDDRVLESLFDLTSDDRRGGDYSTPLEVARQMVQLAAPEPDDLVLDPASGRGTVLSLAAAEGAQGVGVEINLAVLRLATFYVDLFNREVEFLSGDFFDLNAGDVGIPEIFDRVIVDPPFNMRLEGEDIPYAEGRGNLRSEEAFLAKGLSLLDEGGSITLAVPSGFLNDARREWVRTLVLEEFQLESVIQLIDGPIYRNTSIDTAFVTVTKRPSSADHEVQHAVLESPEDPATALADAVSAIKSGTADSLVQSALEDSWNIQQVTNQRTLQETLEAKFPEIVDLQTVADVQTGNPPNNLVEMEDDDTLTYLSISDVSEGSSRHGDRYILQDETRIVADDSCVLLSTLGRNTHTHIPSEPVAPAQDLAVLSFNSADEALVYEMFLATEIGKEQIDALKTGSTISRVNIRDLRGLKVPYFSDDEIRERAASIREHRQETEQLEEKRDSLAEHRIDLLTRGDDDE